VSLKLMRNSAWETYDNVFGTNRGLKNPFYEVQLQEMCDSFWKPYGRHTIVNWISSVTA
jgi:hypothetical protein